MFAAAASQVLSPRSTNEKVKKVTGIIAHRTGARVAPVTTAPSSTKVNLRFYQRILCNLRGFC